MPALASATAATRRQVSAVVPMYTSTSAMRKIPPEAVRFGRAVHDDEDRPPQQQQQHRHSAGACSSSSSSSNNNDDDDDDDDDDDNNTRVWVSTAHARARTHVRTHTCTHSRSEHNKGFEAGGQSPHSTA